MLQIKENAADGTREQARLVAALVRDGGMTESEALLKLKDVRKEASSSALSQAVFGIVFSALGLAVLVGAIVFQVSQGKIRVVLTAFLAVGCLFCLKSLFHHTLRLKGR